jgi:hypothetical protein
MGNQLKLLRFIPCYKSGGGIAGLESLVNAKISLKVKKMNFFAPPLAYNVQAACRSVALESTNVSL